MIDRRTVLIGGASLAISAALPALAAISEPVDHLRWWIEAELDGWNQAWGRRNTMASYARLEAELGFNQFATYAERFGASLVVITAMQREVAFLRQQLAKIRDSSRSAQDCRSAAAYALEKRNAW